MGKSTILLDFPMGFSHGSRCSKGHELDVRRSDGQLERQVSTLAPGTAAPTERARERLKRQERGKSRKNVGKSGKMWENLETCGKI